MVIAEVINTEVDVGSQCSVYQFDMQHDQSRTQEFDITLHHESTIDNTIRH